jgi:hypothetical protein
LKNSGTRRLWEKRSADGEFSTPLPRLLDDETKFYRYFRMTMSPRTDVRRTHPVGLVHAHGGAIRARNRYRRSVTLLNACGSSSSERFDTILYGKNRQSMPTIGHNVSFRSSHCVTRGVKSNNNNRNHNNNNNNNNIRLPKSTARGTPVEFGTHECV